jgi:hypothetical protein
MFPAAVVKQAQSDLQFGIKILADKDGALAVLFDLRLKLKVIKRHAGIPILSRPWL